MKLSENMEHAHVLMCLFCYKTGFNPLSNNPENPDWCGKTDLAVLGCFVGKKHLVAELPKID